MTDVVKESCNKMIVFNPPIACKSYDTTIYSQLKFFEKKALASCGVNKSDPKDAIIKMFFQDANYFDVNWLKRYGAFHNTNFEFSNVMLKPATNEPPKDMTIPKVIAESKEVEAEEPEPKKKKEKGNEEEKFKQNELAWTETPTNPLSHSIYLNLYNSKKTFTKVMFECQEPDPPPPTPPELLKMQEFEIDLLEKCISITTTQILLLINTYFEEERNRLFAELGEEPEEKKPEQEVTAAPTKSPEEQEEEERDASRQASSEDPEEALQKELARIPKKLVGKRQRAKLTEGRIIVKLVTMQDELQKRQKLIQIYQNNVLLLNQLYNKIEDMKFELQQLENEYFEMKKLRDDELSKAKPSGDSVSKSFFSSLQIIPYIKKQIQPFMQKARELKAKLTATRIPTQEELTELIGTINNQKRNISALQVNFQFAIKKYKESNEEIKSFYLQKSAGERFTDRLAGIPPLSDTEFQTFKNKENLFMSQFKGQCTKVENNSEKLIKKANKILREFINDTQEAALEQIKPINKNNVVVELTDLQEYILKIMLQFPVADDKSFTEFQSKFEFPFCPPKPSTLSVPSKSEVEKRSFTWITFESAVALLANRIP
jgi:hypothetical protein